MSGGMEWKDKGKVARLGLEGAAVGWGSQVGADPPGLTPPPISDVSAVFENIHLAGLGTGAAKQCSTLPL